MSRQPPLYALLISVLMVTAPHAEHLPLWISAVCVLLLAWRAWLTYRQQQPPKRWLVALLTLTCSTGVLLDYGTLFGRDAGIALLILLTTLKLLELHSMRDVMVLIHLSCFIVITQFFYSQSIPLAIYMFITLMVMMTTWVQLQAHSIHLKPRLKIAGTLLLQALPLTIALFILFPRIQGPLWGMPQDATTRTGLDESMSPGSMSKLTLSEEVAFRVTYKGNAPTKEEMYWRGPVLWDFDGKAWSPGRTIAFIQPKFSHLENPIDYSIVLEPHNQKWLFALDIPANLSIPAQLTDDFKILNKENINSRIRYEARSYTRYTANEQELIMQLKRALVIPQGNHQAQQLAQSWRTNNQNDQSIVNAALRYFNKQGFSYTLEPPPLLSENTVDEFLFKNKQGFCEHYASAFVFLMRAAQVPARVVTGYQGGEFNDIGNYYIVRQSDAHAWAEVWLKGKGWVRIDPTAAIAPTRIRNGLSASVTNNTALPYLSRNPPAWMITLKHNWDALANHWNVWVLGYNPERQFSLLSKFGMEDISWRKMAWALFIVVAIIMSILAAWMLRHLFKRPDDPIHAAWLKFCKRLAKIGFVRAPHESAQHFAKRIAHERPDLADKVEYAAQRYNILRYGTTPDHASIQQFARTLRKIKIRHHP